MLSGWDFNTNTSSATTDAVNHYYFNVTNGLNNATFTATATLVWNRQQNKTAINNLNLFLYNAPTATSSRAAPAWWTTLNTSSCRNCRGPLRFAGVEAGGTASSATQRDLCAGVGVFLAVAEHRRTGTNVMLPGRFIRPDYMVEADDQSDSAALEHEQLPPPVVTNSRKSFS